MIDRADVTVVIPVHNQETFVRQALESCLAQTYQDFRIVVVDDGSTDNTARILREFADRIRIVVQQNLGTSAAWNQAIGIATTKYLIGLDSDDELFPITVERLLDFATKHPEADVIYSDYVFIDATGNAIKEVRNPEPCDPVAQLVLLHDRLGQPDNFLPFGHVRMYRREALVRIGGYDSRFLYSEDFDLMLRLAEREFILKRIPEILYRYRWHTGNKGVVARERQIEDVRNAVRKFQDRNRNSCEI